LGQIQECPLDSTGDHAEDRGRVLEVGASIALLMNALAHVMIEIHVLLVVGQEPQQKAPPNPDLMPEMKPASALRQKNPKVESPQEIKELENVPFQLQYMRIPSNPRLFEKFAISRKKSGGLPDSTLLTDGQAASGHFLGPGPASKSEEIGKSKRGPINRTTLFFTSYQ